MYFEGYKRYETDIDTDSVDGIELYTVSSESVQAFPPGAEDLPGKAIDCMIVVGGVDADDDEGYTVMLDMVEVPGRRVWYVWNDEDVMREIAARNAFIKERIAMYQAAYPDHTIECDIEDYNYPPE